MRRKKKKDKEREKHTRWSRQKGETIKNTEAQIKTEAARGGNWHLESEMLQLPRGLGEQESPGRGKPPDLAFMSSPGSQLYAGESMWALPPPLPSMLCPRGVLTHQLARLCLICPPPTTMGHMPGLESLLAYPQAVTGCVLHTLWCSSSQHRGSGAPLSLPSKSGRLPGGLLPLNRAISRYALKPSS